VDGFYLYVILDVYSRYAVGWTVQHAENAQVAKALIAQVCDQQKIAAGQAGPPWFGPVAVRASMILEIGSKELSHVATQAHPGAGRSQAEGGRPATR
jgi:transposase InsO family protein